MILWASARMMKYPQHCCLSWIEMISLLCTAKRVGLHLHLVYTSALLLIILIINTILYRNRKGFTLKLWPLLATCDVTSQKPTLPLMDFHCKLVQTAHATHIVKICTRAKKLACSVKPKTCANVMCVRLRNQALEKMHHVVPPGSEQTHVCTFLTTFLV